MKKQNIFIGIILIFTLIIIIPPIQPAPFTINNNNWDGTSKFRELIQKKMNVTESAIPIRLLGDSINYDVVIIVGGNLPYFAEDSNSLFHYVKDGGNLILFEDHGYARIITSAFGISLGGTVIDQDFHYMNPYQPVINQSSVVISGYDISPHQVVFNSAVRVQQSHTVTNSTFISLFKTHGNTWVDANRDGNFYRESEHITINEACYIGGLLDFNEGGKFIVIGDSAFPTNDMINQKENYEMLSAFVDLLVSEGANSVIFDESRKIWIPPTGKAAVGTISVIIMGIFHSPLIAISALIIIGGLLGIRKDELIISSLQNVRKQFQFDKEIKPIAAVIQSEEEEEFARLAKSQVISDLYRSLLADEIRSSTGIFSYNDKIELEQILRKRFIDIRDYNRVLERLENLKEIHNDNKERK